MWKIRMSNASPTLFATLARALANPRRRMVWLGALLAGWMPCATAYNYGPPGAPAGQPAGAWDFRQPGPSNARGMPPAPPPAAKTGQPAAPPQLPPQPQWPGYGSPYGQPGQGAPAHGYPQSPWGYSPPGGYPQAGAQPAGGARPPRIEVAITNDQPYVQENVLLRLRIVSDQNLERADPELPGTNDFLLQRVAGPDTSTRKDAKGNREIVNDFILTLTPLRSGDLELPPIKVSGTQAGSGQGGYPGPATRYEVSSERARVQVRPILTSVSPWLPLHDLNLTANLDSARDVAEGEPVTISLELKAVGAQGSQLPSLEGLLASPDFRVYREQTLTEGGLSADKRSLVGKRTEYYTLVPHSGGRLRMPAIQIAWWNVDKGTREVAGLPIHTLKVEGESGPFGLSRYTEIGHGDGWGLLWIPLAGLMLLVLGYWGGVWYQRRAAAGKGPLGAQVGARLVSGVGGTLRAALARTWSAMGTGLARVARWVNPLAALRLIGRRLNQALPAPTRLWLCVGAADREANPAAWCQQFQEQACRNLSFDPKEPLPGLAAKLARLRPGTDRAQIERLMQQLDGALYGRQDLDFPRWKRDFKRQLRPRSGALKGLIASLTPRRVYLPELNPR